MQHPVQYQVVQSARFAIQLQVGPGVKFTDRAVCEKWLFILPSEL